MKGRVGVELSTACGENSAFVAFEGAQILRWCVGDMDVLWCPDPLAWNEVAPILFPVVGWTRAGIRCKGGAYPLGLHGFARHCEFSLVESGDSFARLRLRDSPWTRSLYPFSFRLDAIFRLSDRAFDWTLEIENTSGDALPYAVGFHPGFCWPLAGSNAPHVLTFEHAESPDVPVIAPGGLFAPQTRKTRLQAGRLELTPADFAQEALCFLDIASQKVVYDNGAGVQLTLALKDFPHVALWAKPPAPFLCVEAWTGYGDPVDFSGELRDKPSMRLLAPAEIATHGLHLSIATDLL